MKKDVQTDVLTVGLLLVICGGYQNMHSALDFVEEMKRQLYHNYFLSDVLFLPFS